jgi:predicted NAD/FAD-dependent oxidoreductase
MLAVALVACIAVIAVEEADNDNDGGGCATASSYVGARERCLTEVGVAAQCPDAFPTWPEAGDASPSCGLAVVGAGAGGLYAARRLVAAGEFTASEVCVFEATERVGGRTYSVRYADLDLAVDAGAYRTWPEYTPVTHALITDWLGLSVACYDPSEDPCEKYIVVDAATGANAGLATYVEALAGDLFAAGARWFPRHKLDALAPASSGGLSLAFANCAAATAATVLLNVPQRPLLEVLRASSAALALPQATFEAAHAVQTEIVQKLYLYYESAWWRELGLTTGDFSLAGDASNMLLKGRYHDGDVTCDENGENCSGFLLAVYAHDYSGESAMFFRRFQRDRP